MPLNAVCCHTGFKPILAAIALPIPMSEPTGFCEELRDSSGGDDMSEQYCNFPAETIVGGFNVDLLVAADAPAPKAMKAAPRGNINDTARAVLARRRRFPILLRVRTVIFSP